MSFCTRPVLQLQSKHVEQALIAYRKALTFAPNSVEVQSGIARAELMAGRESVAAFEFERVLQLDRANSPALLQLGRIYSHERQSWSRAEASYQEFLRLTPDDAQARLELARVLAWERKPKEAVAIFSMESVRPLLNVQDQKDYAFALVQAGGAREAEPMLKKLIATLPGDSEVRLQLASIYAARRDWPAALPLYETLLRENAADARLNLSYGSGLLATEEVFSGAAASRAGPHRHAFQLRCGTRLCARSQGRGQLEESSKRIRPRRVGNARARSSSRVCGPLVGKTRLSRCREIL
jgi:tetratricopeptide (TPR) repeat protein